VPSVGTACPGERNVADQSRNREDGDGAGQPGTSGTTQDVAIGGASSKSVAVVCAGGRQHHGARVARHGEHPQVRAAVAQRAGVFSRRVQPRRRTQKNGGVDRRTGTHPAGQLSLTSLIQRQ